MAFKADEYITTSRGPFQVVRCCKICGHMETYRKGGSGKGYGLAQGGRTIAAMRRHVRDEHPEVLS